MAFHHISVGQKGKDGALEITGKNEVLNEFTTLTRNANKGSKVVNVQNSILNQNNRFSSSLTSGDLVMIIQMQGAIINSNRFSVEWGSILDYGNCGNWEFQEIEAVSAPQVAVRASWLNN